MPIYVQNQGTDNHSNSQGRLMEHIGTGTFEVGVMNLADQIIPQEDD